MADEKTTSSRRSTPHRMTPGATKQPSAVAIQRSAKGSPSREAGDRRSASRAADAGQASEGTDRPAQRCRSGSSAAVSAASYRRPAEAVARSAREDCRDASHRDPPAQMQSSPLLSVAVSMSATYPGSSGPALPAGSRAYLLREQGQKERQTLRGGRPWLRRNARPIPSRRYRTD